MSDTSTGPMPQRQIRVSDQLWHAANAKAQAGGDKLPEIIRHFLRTYVGDDGHAGDTPGSSTRAAD